MRSGAGETGGDPPQESGERGAYRGEEEKREVAHRFRVRQLHAADAGTRRYRRFHLLGYPQGHLDHQRHDVLRGAASHQEIIRERAGRQQETSYFRGWTRSEARRRSVDTKSANISLDRITDSSKFTKEQYRGRPLASSAHCNLCASHMEIRLTLSAHDVRLAYLHT